MTLRKSEKQMAIQMRFLIPKQATEYGPSVGPHRHPIQEQYCSALPVILSMEMVFRMNMITGISLLSQSIRQGQSRQEMAMLPYKLAQSRLVITKHFSSLKKVRQKKKRNAKRTFLIEYLKVAICFIGPLLQH